MFRVYANYCGSSLELASFETWQEAEEFMKHDFLLFSADETEDGQEEWIFTDEMSMCDDEAPELTEEDIPFCEPEIPFVYSDDLPF